jgi:hypothetical protein
VADFQLVYYLVLCFLLQYETTINHCAPSLQNAQDKVVLFQRLLELTDILLDGYRVQLDSIKPYLQKKSARENDRYAELLQKYEQERTALIKPFSECGYW